jgi:hypothetical protein
MIVDISTGEIPKEEPRPERVKNPGAISLGKLGSHKGSQACAVKVLPKKRKEIAKKAAAR